MPKHELHIVIGCADARDLNQIQLDVVRDKKIEYKKKGIEIELQVIRAAGSFVSNDVYQDIKYIILDYQKDLVTDVSDVSYFVHIQTHGHLTDDSNKDYLSHIYEMRVVEGSPLNCGMMSATVVAVDLEQLLVTHNLEYDTVSGKKKINADTDIRELLRDVYAHDGYLAGDWIRSIDYLRTHPRTQKARLEKLLDDDPELKRLGIKITAGIQEYSIHSLIRLDDGEPKAPWWDEVQLEIRERVVSQTDLTKGQNALQEPFAGLICMSDPRQSSRALAADYYMDSKNIDNPEGYEPNTIFNITGSSFDIPSTPFGPYVIAGFYYAVKYLGLTDQIVMGYDARQTERIMNKIHNDPIMNLIAQVFKVNFIKLNQVDLLNN